MYQDIIDSAVSLSSRREGRNPPLRLAAAAEKRLKFAVHPAKRMGNRTLIFRGGTRLAMRSFYAAAAAALLTICAATRGESQAPASDGLAYADLADLGLAASVAAHVRVAKTVVLEGPQAAGVRPGFARFLVEADVLSLIRAAQGLPTRVRYVVDLPRDARNRAPKLRKGSQFILLADPVAGRPGELRLVAPDAQLAWTPARAERLRAILREVQGSAPAPRITGIGRAFHAPGSLSGESETQIFLQTANGRPVSLNVLRRPGATPLWSVALSEIVDDAAQPPARDTLLWYRLACTLPPSLPDQSLAESDADAAGAIRADYSLVLTALGPCARTRARD